MRGSALLFPVCTGVNRYKAAVMALADTLPRMHGGEPRAECHKVG